MIVGFIDIYWENDKFANANKKKRKNSMFGCRLIDLLKWVYRMKLIVYGQRRLKEIKLGLTK